MWLLYAFLMFLASNALYLLIRLVQKQGLPISFYSIFIFLLPSIIYFVAASLTQTSLVLPFEQFVLVLAAAFVWSYLGNLFSQKALLAAPNPGYSLILQKSYVVLTTIAAVFLFAAEFSWQKLIAIGVILLFSVVITYSPQNRATHRSVWIYFSLLAHLCFVFGSLMSKHFLNLGIEPFVYLFYINLFVATLNSWHFISQKIQVKVVSRQWLALMAIGIFSAAFNFSMQLAYKTAPNIGYVSAINTASIMSLTFLSAILFKDDLSKSKIIGVAGVFLGLLLLVL